MILSQFSVNSPPKLKFSTRSSSHSQQANLDWFCVQCTDNFFWTTSQSFTESIQWLAHFKPRLPFWTPSIINKTQQLPLDVPSNSATDCLLAKSGHFQQLLPDISRPDQTTKPMLASSIVISKFTLLIGYDFLLSVFLKLMHIPMAG